MQKNPAVHGEPTSSDSPNSSRSRAAEVYHEVCYIAWAVESWKLLLIALGAAMFLEGLPYFIAPGGTRRVLAQLLTQSEDRLRLIGFVLMAGGLITAWLASR